MYKKQIFSILVLSAIILLSSCGGKKPNYKVRLKNDVDSASYLIGYDLGVQVAYSEIDDFNVDAMAKGVLDAIKKGIEDEETMYQDQQERQMYLQMFFMKLRERIGEKALKEGEDFLEANKSKSGVVVTPSGLQYKIIRDGSGMRPTMSDMVEAIYHGSLIDGTVFDSSKEDGRGAVLFDVSRLVQGFSEALTLMKEGSIWEVYIPSELGYGQYPPQGSVIKANSVIIFEIELVRIINEESDEE